MKDRFFIDTNIFIYSFDSNNPDKQQIALELIGNALQSSSGVISYQVIQEFLNVASRKFVKPLSISDCQKYLNIVLEPLCEVFTSFELYHQALEIMDRWRLSFYDSLIISAAFKANCNLIYTEDLQHGQKVGDLEIVNPFSVVF